MPAILMMGIAYGCVAGTASNSLIYLVPKGTTGMALGLQAFVINIGLCLTPLVYGELKDRTPSCLESGYFYITRMSLFLSVMGLVMGVVMWGHDVYFNNGLLKMNVEERN